MHLVVPVLLSCLLALPDARELVDNLRWRNLGPANMGGRVVDIAVHPERSSIFYVATASGGLFRTVNNGTTFRAIFDDQATASLGDVCLSPSSPNTVWVGTGEANGRNSVSWGNGIYRSDDGGVSWNHLGLEETRHIGRIVVHPTDSDTVFVAALGNTWRRNPERGLYRTTDGGATWERVLFVDDQTGCVDVLLDPRDPDVIFAATYQRMRDAFDGGKPEVHTGPGSGIWRSRDGGDSWERLQTGLPTRSLGRIGLAIGVFDDQATIYAVVETDLTGKAAPTSATPHGDAYLGVQGKKELSGFRITRVVQNHPASKSGLQVGDLVTTIGGTSVLAHETLKDSLALFRAGDRTKVHLLRRGREEALEVTLGERPASGGFRSGMQGGQRPNVQDRQGTYGFETGGVFRSDDDGGSWKRVNSLNPRPFYYSQIRLHPTNPDCVYVLGIDLHRSLDGGHQFDLTLDRNTHPDHHALWIDPEDPDHLLLGNDGGVYKSYDGGRTWDFLDHLAIGQFYNVAVDHQQPYSIYGGLQDNGTWGGPSAAPRRGPDGGVLAADWFKIGGGDGFHCAVDPRQPFLVYCESQYGAIVRQDLRTGERLRIRPPRQDIRFHWNTPFLLSPHDPDTLYFAGSEVIRATERGAHSESLSRGFELGMTARGTATALSESPLVPGMLVVGTDDGAVWLTLDHGNRWQRISDQFPPLGNQCSVSEVIASRFQESMVYVALDAHRTGDTRPYLLVSDDFGQSFRFLSDNLPDGSVRCLEEDPIHAELLYLGTEFGCYVSLDRGEQWTRFRRDFPTVPVYDLVVHPTAQELVVATHGRGIWILDVAPLQQLKQELLASGSHLFEIRPAILWNKLPTSDPYGSRRFVGENPAPGAGFYYYLNQEIREGVTLTVHDTSGRRITRLHGSGKPGIQAVQWNLSVPGGRAAPGEYTATLTAAGISLQQSFLVQPDPDSRETPALISSSR